MRRLPQNKGVRASFFRKSQNDQEKRGSEAIASLMRESELDAHTKLLRKGTREDYYLTSAVAVVKHKGLYVLYAVCASNLHILDIYTLQILLMERSRWFLSPMKGLLLYAARTPTKLSCAAQFGSTMLFKGRIALLAKN